MVTWWFTKTNSFLCLRFIPTYIIIFFFLNRVSVCGSLSVWNSLKLKRSACLCPPRAKLKGMYHHTLLQHGQFLHHVFLFQSSTFLNWAFKWEEAKVTFFSQDDSIFWKHYVLSGYIFKFHSSNPGFVLRAGAGILDYTYLHSKKQSNQSCQNLSSKVRLASHLSHEQRFSVGKAHVCITPTHMKNWEPLVCFPRFAIDKRNALSCLRIKFSSFHFAKDHILFKVSTVNWFSTFSITFTEVPTLNHKVFNHTVECRTFIT